MNPITLLLTLFLALLIPDVTQAAGFVPCGGAGEPDCQFCHILQLVNNATTWLVTILSILMPIIIVVSGLVLVTSTGDVSAKETAKKRIINSAVGFVIVLSTWLLIDLGMKMLVDGDSDLGPWNVIQCTVQPEPGLSPEIQNYVDTGVNPNLSASNNGMTQQQFNSIMNNLSANNNQDGVVYVPPGVVLTEPVDMAHTGSQIRISLKNEIKSTKFTTTSGTNYSGQFSFTSTTGNSGVQRRVWVSTTPGQLFESVPVTCRGTGNSTTVVYWQQFDGVYCDLEPNSTYYLNFQNIGCSDSAGCDVYRNIYTNGDPYGGSISNSSQTCGPKPSGVQVKESINWAQPGSSIRISMVNETIAMPFTSTNNPNYEGQVAIAATTGNSNVTREVWISKCPGESYYEVPDTCRSAWSSTTVVNWHQNTDGRFCALDLNTKYYINVRNVNCEDRMNGDRCDIYRMIYHN